MAKYRLMLNHRIGSAADKIAAHLCGMGKYEYKSDDLDMYHNRALKYALLVFLAITENETVNRFTRIKTAFGDDVNGLNSVESEEIIRLFKTWSSATWGFNEVLDKLNRFDHPHMSIDNVKLQKKYCMRIRCILRNFGPDMPRGVVSDLVEFLDS